MREVTGIGWLYNLPSGDFIVARHECMMPYLTEIHMLTGPSLLDESCLLIMSTAPSQLPRGATAPPRSLRGAFAEPSRRSLSQFVKPLMQSRLPVGSFRSESAFFLAQPCGLSISGLWLLGLCRKVSTALSDTSRSLRVASVDILGKGIRR